ncbi:MAG: 3-isopropylmalate dehydratase large subunit [Spirochaetes bacterium GWF1_51_8]|nr:MAG: 3-isopropylmalate dehydratase large subunit [Spirochaetes bacterium GWF1_51_8]
MGMTMSEKILAAHAGKDFVEPGEIIDVKVDFCLGNDVTAPISIQNIRKLGAKKVWDAERIALVPDHFTPNKDIKSAEQVKILRDFAKEYGIKYFFEMGRVGVEHVLLPELGLTLPGDVIIGADSHTCTYGAFGAFSTGVGSTDLAFTMLTGKTWFKVPEQIKFIYNGKLGKWVSSKDLILYTIGKIGVDGALYKTMEFTGETLKGLTIHSRATMANMAIEAGAKNGIFAVDNVTLDYIKPRAKRPYKAYDSDPDAKYCETHEYDVSKIEPQVSFPHLPENTKNVSEASGVKIDQVFVGACTNGKYEDIEIAANLLKGRKVHPDVRLLVIPATQAVWMQAIKNGLAEILVEAGAVFSTPTCGPCLGGHMGILAKGERAVATSNRNFVGRMGDPGSEVYLTSPAVAAASAVKGYIAHPDELK